MANYDVPGDRAGSEGSRKAGRSCTPVTCVVTSDNVGPGSRGRRAEIKNEGGHYGSRYASNANSIAEVPNHVR